MHIFQKCCMITLALLTGFPVFCWTLITSTSSSIPENNASLHTPFTLSIYKQETQSHKNHRIKLILIWTCILLTETGSGGSELLFLWEIVWNWHCLEWTLSGIEIVWNWNCLEVKLPGSKIILKPTVLSGSKFISPEKSFF